MVAIRFKRSFFYSSVIGISLLFAYVAVTKPKTTGWWSPVPTIVSSQQIPSLLVSRIPAYYLMAKHQWVRETSLRRVELLMSDSQEEEAGLVDRSLVLLDKVVVIPRVC